MNLEELNKKIDDNAQKIIDNLKRIDTNKEKIEQNSYALEILKDYKGESKRLFTILIIVLVMWFATIGYLVYVLNDIGYEETTTETYTQEISDIETIENSSINNRN